MKKKEYYLQNKRGSQPYVGNSLLWWAIDDCGYVCDLRCARVWTEEEMKKAKKDSRPCDIFWPKEVIDRLVQHHIDVQDLRKNNDGSYRKAPHSLSSKRPDLIPKGGSDE